ncbi:hypothetical protein TRFO_01458 [Tritrichomonas foetus]|uniref:Importin N-terminal domain-containing protein n=1 Tax=Tritrichomonas foetus TaxID=1144522 RepID=A0A1J4K218_9EUKA|nr:hypothetical protein TRFO_01458 [Tritrichomonas foetus]|eukprot:OHT03788.1 hypothetical protein TRFO_01458 [Tritrichomonas foetus]
MQELTPESIINLLHMTYQDGNRVRESSAILKSLANPENSNTYNSYANLLNYIILNSKDSNLVSAAIIQIRELQPDAIFSSLKLLSEQMDPQFHRLIEILSDYLAKNYVHETVNVISQNQHPHPQTLKIMFQLCSSLMYYQGEEKIVREFLTNLYQPHLNFIITLLNNPTMSPDLIIILYCFLKTHGCDIIKNNHFEFLHKLICLLFTNHINFPSIDILNLALQIYSKLSCINGLKNFTSLTFQEIFAAFFNYFEATKIFPINLTFIINLFLREPEIIIQNLELAQKILFEIIFPRFLDVNPQDLSDFEYFINRYHPDFSIDTDFEKIIRTFNMVVFPNELIQIISHFIETTMELSKENEFILYGIFNIFTGLLSSPNENLYHFVINFIDTKISSLIPNLTPNMPPNLIVCGILNFISHLPKVYLINRNILGLFLKTFALCPNFENNNLVKVAAYHSIIGISKFIKPYSIDFIPGFIEIFTQQELQGMFLRIFNLNNEIQTDKSGVALEVFISLVTPKEEIVPVIGKIWEILLMTVHDQRASSNYTKALDNLFIKCDDDLKQIVFIQIFERLNYMIDSIIASNANLNQANNYDERSDNFIEVNINGIFQLLFSFYLYFLQTSDDIPKMLQTVGVFTLKLFECCNSLVIEDNLEFYVSFTFALLKVTTAFEQCEMIIQYMLEVFHKLEENEIEFTFETLSAFLIKFHDSPAAFQVMNSLRPTIDSNKFASSDTKSYFYTSLILANPSQIFECSDQDFLNFMNIYFRESIFYLFADCVKQILLFANQNKSVIMANTAFQNRLVAIIHAYNERREDSDVIYDGSDESDAIFFVRAKIFKEDLCIIVNTIAQLIISLQ